jgi:hypothetical protein
MGGGLMQLVAYGAQDVYLTGNPQITFFKVVYRRHTNFAMESVEQTFNGQADFGKRVTATIGRNGDLISRIYLQVTLPAVSTAASTTTSSSFRWVNYIGHCLIRYVTVDIGGQQIDKQYGDWLTIWNELSQRPGLHVGYDNMVGNTVNLTGTGLGRTEASTLYVPLQFWFCRNPGLALPLIALQYHEVRINLELRNKAECYVVQDTSMVSTDCTASPPQFCVPSLVGASLFIDYIYLDTDERRRFAQSSHEYLIEQLQFTGDESVTSTNVKVKLNFNHPVKELIWVVQKDTCVAANVNQWTNYTDRIDNDTTWGATADALSNINTNVESGYMASSFPYANVNSTNNLTTAQVPFNSATTSGVGWTSGTTGWGDLGDGNADTNAPLNTGNTGAATGSDHAGIGPLNAGRNPVVRAKLQLNGHDRFQERLGSYFNLVQPFQHHSNVPATGINVYSFALEPEKHQPSGTCNFSRIDSAVLQLQLTSRATTGSPQGYSSSTAAGSKVRVYAVNYNVLRIMSGMGGLGYAN